MITSGETSASDRAGGFGRVLVVACLAVFTGCTGIDPEGRSFQPDSGDRRMYVNDSAPNESLRTDLFRGVNFFSQPGATYTLHTQGEPTGAKWYFYESAGGYWRRQTPARATVSPLAGFTSRFEYRRQAANGGWTWAILAGDVEAPGPLTARLFTGNGPYDGDSTCLDYYFWGNTSQFPDASSRQLLVDSIQFRLAAAYGTSGIQIGPAGGPYSIGGTEAVQLTFPLARNVSPPLGASQRACIHVVFVEAIVAAPGPLRESTDVLGFSPREAHAFDAHAHNLVFMSLQRANYPVGSSLAHEMGHFFGLRHTTPQGYERTFEDDLSNIDDGLSDTAPCQDIVHAPLARMGRAGARNSWCLRRLALQAPVGGCDSTNLMYPFALPGVSQTTLSPEQQEFLHANLGLLPH